MGQQSRLAPVALLILISVLFSRTIQGMSLDRTHAATSAGRRGRHGPVHFFFIVHGHNGQPTDLSYLHHTIKQKAIESNKYCYVASSQSCPVGIASGDREPKNGSEGGTLKRRISSFYHLGKQALIPEVDTAEDDASTTEPSLESSSTNLNGVGTSSCHPSAQNGTLIVHNAACNEGKTHDGVANGGDRLANEIKDVVLAEVNARRDELDVNADSGLIDVTLSMSGNSLGGLYTRYAIASLVESLQRATSGDVDSGSAFEVNLVLDETIRIHFNVFCTTASPHLGCADHTYVPLPRAAERALGMSMGETGRDLFRMNELLYEMATSRRFLGPLAAFTRRIAYANAYGTDFPVPGSTAAFLDRESEYPHYFAENFDEENWTQLDSDVSLGTSAGKDFGENDGVEKRLIVATLYTPYRSIAEEEGQTESLKSSHNGLTLMSNSLDALAWKKCFVDMRGEMPVSIGLPRSLSWSERGDCPIRRLRSKAGVVASRDIDYVINDHTNGYRLAAPLGHNAVCAFSRGTFSTYTNSGGRPVMDYLATDLVDKISRSMSGLKVT